MFRLLGGVECDCDRWSGPQSEDMGPLHAQSATQHTSRTQCQVKGLRGGGRVWCNNGIRSWKGMSFKRKQSLHNSRSDCTRAEGEEGLYLGRLDLEF